MTVDDVIARAAYPPPPLTMTVDDVIGLGRVKWQDVGPTRPVEGRELFNIELSNSLAFQRESFTEDEWRKFGIEDLRIDDFIKSEKKYFRPDGRNKQARARAPTAQTARAELQATPQSEVAPAPAPAQEHAAKPALQAIQSSGI